MDEKTEPSRTLIVAEPTENEKDGEANPAKRQFQMPEVTNDRAEQGKGTYTLPNAAMLTELPAAKDLAAR